MRGSDGFSFVEMLVVVAILSILAIGATLPFSRGSASVAGDAGALEQAADGLRSLAMISDRPRALALSPGGWQAERRSGGGWAAEGAPMAFAAATASLAGDEPSRIVFLPDGRAFGPDVLLDAPGTAMRCTVAEGRLRCAP